MSIDRLMDKDVVCIHNGKSLGHEKMEILPFETTSMDINGIMLNEISQKQILRSYLYVGSKTKTK